MNKFSPGELYLLPQEEFRSISAENPDGAKGGGASAEPDAGNYASLLGKTWKVRPCITVKAGETVTLADIKGVSDLVGLNGGEAYGNPALFQTRTNELMSR